MSGSSDLPAPAAFERAGIQPERVAMLNDAPVRAGRYVLYWMQASQRTRCNHALAYAVRAANALRRPLVVCFGLTGAYPGANRRHYAFLLEGLRDVAAALRKRGVAFVLRRGEPDAVACALGQAAALVVVDRGYTRVQVGWRAKAARALACRLVQVEADVVVPVETASGKEEYAARTIRPRIHAHRDRFLVPLPSWRVRVKADALDCAGEALADADGLLDALDCDASVPPSPVFSGGEREAATRLRRFVKARLARYDAGRNDPTADATSGLSPYLHFGQIAPLEIALAVKEAAADANAEAFLEQLIVRRELAINFVYYNDRYDSFDCLPDWAVQALAKHRSDTRDPTYTYEQFARGQTHDPAWNAAQMQMVKTGHMAGYMRMYWGKKVLEWSADPRAAYATLLQLNDTYELDGRDPNGYAGVAWVFGKHDRPWARRPVFGTVRYMNAAGLRRKFDVEAYIRAVASF